MTQTTNTIFGATYRDKRVLVTGHTGFKGTWLTAWLLKLGAKVIGFSDRIPTDPAMFEVLDLEGKIEHHIGDVRDAAALARVIETSKPDFVFHLAAQAIVSTSYQEPLDTISTNVMGTANILEVLRHVNHPCTAVLITSDKCYENVEWPWGYKETDHLGGRDIYSGSKGAAEVIAHSYYWAFFRDPAKTPVRIATGRAGNVIGGGDWAKDRIIVDCVRAWSKGETVEIRSPEATRPWQHVLEPLSGYLTLGAELARDQKLCGESFNFGPRTEQNKTVVSLLGDLRKHWAQDPTGEAYRITGHVPFHEAGLLRLNCDKAAFFLKWEAALNYAECIGMVGRWYSNFYSGQPENAYTLTLDQIDQYEAAATKRGLAWTK
ncbi:CDP-glucose 4,6-dehydratase [Pandoraea sp. PE-S2T-3]|uniref:CDP-glucose 4,6-dehydratase n=1 Tax=Pandoraea sp. PE-S2T-3 TaxID=1986993 RepID=UPI000B3FF656|nr:CDP-glucose 4,6-dehydratase [Pandoraea sp. PE-S2T-3]